MAHQQDYPLHSQQTIIQFRKQLVIPPKHVDSQRYLLEWLRGDNLPFRLLGYVRLGELRFGLGILGPLE
jgi:hypothetical protein